MADASCSCYLVVVDDVHDLLLEVLAKDIRSDLRGLLNVDQLPLLLGGHEIRQSGHYVNRLHVALLLAPEVAPRVHEGARELGILERKSLELTSTA